MEIWIEPGPVLCPSGRISRRTDRAVARSICRGETGPWRIALARGNHVDSRLKGEPGSVTQSRKGEVQEV